MLRDGILFVARNVGMPTAIAVTVLGQIILAVFATVDIRSQATLFFSRLFFSSDACGRS
jgi:hypothetical protein